MKQCHRCDEVWKEEPLGDGTEGVSSQGWETTFAVAKGRITVLKGRGKEAAVIKGDSHSPDKGSDCMKRQKTAHPVYTKQH